MVFLFNTGTNTAALFSIDVNVLLDESLDLKILVDITTSDF